MAQNTTNDETPRKPIRCNEGTAREARLRDCIRLLTPMKGKRISTYPLPQAMIDDAFEGDDE